MREGTDDAECTVPFASWDSLVESYYAQEPELANITVSSVEDFLTLFPTPNMTYISNGPDLPAGFRKGTITPFTLAIPAPTATYPVMPTLSDMPFVYAQKKSTSSVLSYTPTPPTGDFAPAPFLFSKATQVVLVCYPIGWYAKCSETNLLPVIIQEIEDANTCVGDCVLEISYEPIPYPGKNNTVQLARTGRFDGSQIAITRPLEGCEGDHVIYAKDSDSGALLGFEGIFETLTVIVTSPTFTVFYECNSYLTSGNVTMSLIKEAGDGESSGEQQNRDPGDGNDGADDRANNTRPARSVTTTQLIVIVVFACIIFVVCCAVAVFCVKKRRAQEEHATRMRQLSIDKPTTTTGQDKV